MPVSVLNHQKEVEHTVEVLPKKDKEAVTLSEVERDSKAKVVMAAAKVAAIMAAAKVVMVAAKDMAITMVVISDSIVARPIAIGMTC